MAPFTLCAIVFELTDIGAYDFCCTPPSNLALFPNFGSTLDSHSHFRSDLFFERVHYLRIALPYPEYRPHVLRLLFPEPDRITRCAFRSWLGSWKGLVDNPGVPTRFPLSLVPSSSSPNPSYIATVPQDDHQSSEECILGPSPRVHRDRVRWGRSLCNSSCQARMEVYLRGRA